jgi:hypothetical protein
MRRYAITTNKRRHASFVVTMTLIVADVARCINVGGGPTDDKPEDIARFYELWRSRPDDLHRLAARA